MSGVLHDLHGIYNKVKNKRAVKRASYIAYIAIVIIPMGLFISIVIHIPLLSILFDAIAITLFIYATHYILTVYRNEQKGAKP